MDDDIIPGLKEVETVDLNDPNFTYLLIIWMRPSVMNSMFLLPGGRTEKTFILAQTREALDEFIKRNDLKIRPRLIEYMIVGPNGIELRFPPKKEIQTPGVCPECLGFGGVIVDPGDLDLEVICSRCRGTGVPLDDNSNT